MRKFFFKPQFEDRIYEKLKSFLWSFFNKIAAQTDPGCPIKAVSVIEERPDENRRESDDEEINNEMQHLGNQQNRIIGPKEYTDNNQKEYRQIYKGMEAKKEMPSLIGMNAQKFLNSADFKITKANLLSTQHLTQASELNTKPGTKKQANTVANYYSKIAEINERGELVGDETTDTENSQSSADEDEYNGRKGKREEIDLALDEINEDMLVDS